MNTLDIASLTPDWHADALCAQMCARFPYKGRYGYATEDWFPDPGSHDAGTTDKLKKVLRICSLCPVKRECLVAAMHEEVGAGRRYGIRGGVGGATRHRYRNMDREQAVDQMLEIGRAKALRLGLLNHDAVKEEPRTWTT